MVGDDTLGQQKPRTYIKKVSRNKNCVTIKGILFGITNKAVYERLNFLLINRDTKREIESKCNVTKLNNGSILFEAELNLDSHVFVYRNREEILDAFLIANQSKIKIRIGNPSFWVKNRIKDFVFKNSKTDMCSLTPYYTFKENNLSFKLNVFNNENYYYMKKVMFFSLFFRLIYKRKNIWLLGELDYRAQDNAMMLYNYLRENYRAENVYYVIDRESNDRRNLKDQTNVIHFGSKKHILYTIVANKILTTHHPDYIYPTSMNKFKKKVKGKKLFLTHGIFGVKNMYKNYGNYMNGFKVDHIITSSEQERQAVINQLKYNKAQVSVTGIPRLDKLFVPDVSAENAILVIPTWRDWLITKEPFEESEYYHRYLSLIQSNFLRELCERYNVKLTFCIHPNFRMYTKYFSSSFAEIMFQGEVNIQDLIKSHKLMVTDYSSVGFDFSLLNKPVIFYGFDIERFTNNEKSHIKIPEALPGDFIKDDKQLFQMIEYYVKSNFSQKKEHRLRAEELIKYRDLNACNRVYQVAKTIKKSSKRKSDNFIWKTIITSVNKLLNITP